MDVYRVHVSGGWGVYCVLIEFVWETQQEVIHGVCFLTAEAEMIY